MERNILLALSSFRFTEAEVELALKRCKEAEAQLQVLFVVDVNLARYFSNIGPMAGSSLREQLEDGIRDELRQKAQAILNQVCEHSKAADVKCNGVMRTGRFAEEVVKFVQAETPERIIVTRAHRPEWLRRLFGSPVDTLARELAGICELEVVIVPNVATTPVLQRPKDT